MKTCLESLVFQVWAYETFRNRKAHSFGNLKLCLPSLLVSVFSCCLPKTEATKRIRLKRNVQWGHCIQPFTLRISKSFHTFFIFFFFKSLNQISTWSETWEFHPIISTDDWNLRKVIFQFRQKVIFSDKIAIWCYIHQKVFSCSVWLLSSQMIHLTIIPWKSMLRYILIIKSRHDRWQTLV